MIRKSKRESSDGRIRERDNDRRNPRGVGRFKEAEGNRERTQERDMSSDPETHPGHNFVNFKTNNET